MNWLAANPLALAAMWAAAAALAVWLYMHTRQPQRRRVATLRFWNSVQPVSQPRRLRIREPWALLAQLLFLLLLIVALANPHWGATSQGRSVVIVLDTSIWSQVRVRGESPWIDGVYQEAQRVLNALPAGDPVLLMSAEADVPSILPFTTDRSALRRAIVETRASSGAADVPRALKTGRAALTGSDRGLLVYVGPGMLDDQQAQELDAFREQMETAGGGGRTQFLVRLVGGTGPVQNWGITRLALRRDATQPDRWHLLTQVKNYTDTEARVTLKLSVSGQSFVDRAITLTPGELANVENEFVWDQGGLLQADITPSDSLDSDNHAAVAIPAFQPVRVALFTTDPVFAKNVAGVLGSNPYLQTETESPGSAPKNTPDVAIYQGMSLPEQPALDSIWFLGGNASSGSPLLRVTDWNSQHPAARWVRSHDVSVRNPAPLHVLPGDTVLASAGGNPPVPLIVAREQQGHRLVIIGFDPHDSNFQLQSAFPLLMAGSIEWMTHPVEEAADSFSAGEVNLPGAATRIISPSGKDLPFAREGAGVRLLAHETGVYRVMGPNGETEIAVNTPLLPTERLKPTALEAAVPQPEPPLEVRLTLWRWLMVLAIGALLVEWLLYYSSTRKRQLAESRERVGDTGTKNLGPHSA